MATGVIQFKTEEEIELMRAAGQLLARAHGEVAALVREGATTRQLDRRAEEFIRDNGATPSFKGYNNFPYSLCLSPNSVVVHGFATDEPLKGGDILSVDCGVFLNGYHADSAYTYPIGEVSPEVRQLLKETEASLYKGIEQAISGNRVGDISFAIQNHVAPKGYGVVRELVGHGVGAKLHEKPEVPNYGKRGSGPLLQTGMTLAIEPMVTLGKKDVVQEKDGWTIRTRDKKPAAHFEHTVVVRKDKAEILTSFSYIEKALQ
ncbi:type I methionyl aminopeptidase [Hymenobacter sp. UV11]|uniref:type I methionyl aminopeptidase n=1 Tax=Hymenobacter sp. UV11 TaxID=1849735 RepID=UPI001061F0DB|nr:type I methionyl aminopeptidase [Hymenobacter sp. UV11]TDN39058.1 type I methionyl aminopeptidase [Hymenobacter sp. UV11]TFZ65854.1 type I methionyl aminopeptidase [Hymenobacter sp. UV11]